MSKITTLDRTALKALREPIEAELAALGERLGLKFHVGSGTFGEGAEASFKLEIKVDDPVAQQAAAQAIWNRNCGLIGLDFNNPAESGLRPEDFGTEFTYGSGPRAVRYRTTGIALKGRGSQKFPILVLALDGPNKDKNMMLPETAVAIIRAATDAAKLPA